MKVMKSSEGGLEMITFGNSFWTCEVNKKSYTIIRTHLWGSSQDDYFGNGRILRLYEMGISFV